VSPIAEFDHHHDGFGLTAAADRERAGYRPALDPYGEFHARGTMTVLFPPAQGVRAAFLLALSMTP
jgi:hypothetical protein